MITVDEQYRRAAEALLSGYSEKDAQTPVRPRWEDGTPAYTRYLPQQIFSYEPGQVPLTNYRRTAWKTAIRELLWIYAERSNDVSVLREKYKVNYWDSWQKADGTLGTAYGYQTAKRFRSPETGELIDQVDRLTEQLRENPLNRRLMISLIDMDDIADMALVPCAFLTLWTVSGEQLNCTLIQRSGDFLAAAAPGGINAFQYYVLMRIMAQVSGYKPGRFVHFIQNLHIYDRHESILRQVLTTDVENRPVPRLHINPEKHEIRDFVVEDFSLEGYQPDRTKYEIPIAL